MAGSPDFRLVLSPPHCAASWLRAAMKAFGKKSQSMSPYRTGGTEATVVRRVGNGLSVPWLAETKIGIPARRPPPRHGFVVPTGYLLLL